MLPRALSILALVLLVGYSQAIFRAGVAKVDGTMPLGTPLAGYNHGSRRAPNWPLPYPDKYTTWMMGSTGVMDPTWLRALVIDDGTTEFAFLTIDAIGADGTLNEMAYDIAVGMGFTVPYSNCIFSSSHTHSGPGAMSPSFLWSLAPATDLLVPELQRFMATNVATALTKAQKNKVSAKMNVTIGQLLGVTENRRADISPYVGKDTIDPNLGVIRVDDANGNALATVWNFAIHGICYGPDNMQFSGDIMGKTNDYIEQQTGGVSLFINADAGDIRPAGGMCNNAPNFKGSSIMAQQVVKVRSTMGVSNNINIKAASKVVPFGPTNLNATLARFLNCTHGGPIDICTFCAIINCDDNLHLFSNWLETTPRFTGMKLSIDNVLTYVGTVPGEPLLELGWWLRNDTQDAGFTNTILAGYSNNHMGYFCTPNEYDIGGYESQLTFWGYYTANMIRDAFKSVMTMVR